MAMMLRRDPLESNKEKIKTIRAMLGWVHVTAFFSNLCDPVNEEERKLIQ